MMHPFPMWEQGVHKKDCYGSMSDFFRVFVEKRDGMNNEAVGLQSDVVESLGVSGLVKLRLINIYELTSMNPDQLDRVKRTVLSESPLDELYDRVPLGDDPFFSYEYLPGQFDQRADSAAQCIRLIYPEWDGVVRSSRLIILEGSVSDKDISRIKNYCINPVESREKDLSGHSLFDLGSVPGDVPILSNFNGNDPAMIKKDMGLAMSEKDISFCQEYFGDIEKRSPTETEIRVLDTYWSDHCRHTTFETEITEISLPEGDFHELLEKGLTRYTDVRQKLGRQEKPVTLMDLATIAGRRQRHDGLLDDMEVSEEINACSVRINVDVDGTDEPWLLMFKNETHNHPTEIEPFGGASTCIGGAIRDPLSGRSYVYQAMRITGASDPGETLEDTLPGKLPQKYITRTAAHGYSSYGNQIGLATSFVREIYDPGYKAKRMEVGAVVGAVPENQVRRESPVPGDAVVLIGGKTGRDGCGGATGSSKEHTNESLESCSAEVQKGNAPEERKIQRLFRNPELTAMIKKCNDFGAGGVSVAIGELSPGLVVNLDKVPVKYNGLSGTELAISESQERMAVVCAPEDTDKMIALAAAENLEAVEVAKVTDKNRLVLNWRGRDIVDLDRKFLDTNGVRQHTEAVLPPIVKGDDPYASDLKLSETKETFLSRLSDLDVCSQKGLVEMFDASIGSSTVHMPYGGRYQLSESELSVHKLPVPGGKTDTCSLMAYGFDPVISRWSPYHGSIYAVVNSLARLVAGGGVWRKTRLSFQEYFRRLGTDPKNWGLPLTALLGALEAQESLDIPAIGGKDSMSGSFHDIHVPPTLISFAVTTGKLGNMISSEFKKAGHSVYCLPAEPDENLIPRWEKLKEGFDRYESWVAEGKIKAAGTVKSGGIGAQIFRMSVGNGIGFRQIDSERPLFVRGKGDIIFESDDPTLCEKYSSLILLGETTSEPELRFNKFSITLGEALSSWKGRLNPVFKDDPDRAESKTVDIPDFKSVSAKRKGTSIAKPMVFIPVFPGTNCEYDTRDSFRKAGAETEISVFRNRDQKDVRESLREMSGKIRNSQILMLSGGFSAGDEPEGSGKFIANVLRNPDIADAIEDLLKRDGLILGICNGFQALVKSGLLPGGHISELGSANPTLARNINNRHISRMVTTRVSSTLSPWLSGMSNGDLHEIAISHGEGRFTAPDDVLNELVKNGQVAFQYCDSEGNAVMNPRYNPNGSDMAIEGISSPCGRILGKMGHTERFSSDNFINIPGNKFQPLFNSGVEYFKS